jgi:hypothetical protein
MRLSAESKRRKLAATWSSTTRGEGSSMRSPTNALRYCHCSLAALALVLSGAPLHAQADKPREAIIAVQTKADEGKDEKPNETIRETSKLLKEKLTKAKADGGEGKDADIYLLGDLPKEAAGQDMDVPSLEKLEEFLKRKAKDKRYACLNSIHFVGHGSTVNEALLFPPDSSGKPVMVKGDATKATPATHKEVPLRTFGQTLNAVLCPDGETYLEECYSGQDTIGQPLADIIGRPVFGYTGKVVFSDACPPIADRDSNKVKFEPTTPSTSYEGSTPRKGSGLTYYWKVTGNLQDVICDVHIKLSAKTDPKKLSNPTAMTQQGKKEIPLPGWKGSVGKGPDGNYMHFYGTDCAKNGQAGLFKVKVDVADKKAQDKDPSSEKVVLTRNGRDTFTETDVIKELTAEVPTFLPVALADPVTPARPPGKPQQPSGTATRQPGGTAPQQPALNIGIGIGTGVHHERRREHHRVPEHDRGGGTIRGGGTGGFGITPSGGNFGR